MPPEVIQTHENLLSPLQIIIYCAAVVLWIVALIWSIRKGKLGLYRRIILEVSGLVLLSPLAFWIFLSVVIGVQPFTCYRGLEAAPLVSR
jgi:hypothetical protein